MLRKFFTHAAATAAILTTLATLAITPAARAQAQDQPQQGGFGEQVDVNEVLLDVLVTDAKGNVIVGLKPEDFVVKEDGKIVDLSGLTFYSNRRLVGTSTADAATDSAIDRIPEDRYFILFFDDQKDTVADAPQLISRQLEAGRQAREWVLEGRQPSDWVAVVSYDHKLKVQQDFTRDGRALAEAVAAAQKGKDAEGNWPSRIKEGEGPSLYAGLPRGNELRDRTDTIYDAIRELSRAAGNIRGRKNLVMFTAGFGRVNSFGQYVPDPRYYPDMARALNDNNVAVYSIDLVPTGTTHPLSSAMNQISNETGGQYYGTFTSFATPLRQIGEENSGYYLLSYQSDQPAGKSGFQDVKVTTTNPEFKVRARKGYSFGEENRSGR